MFEIDALSLVYGICIGIVPTVILMVAAVAIDEKMNRRREHDRKYR